MLNSSESQQTLEPSRTRVSGRSISSPSLECLFSSTAFLEVGFQSEVLPPGGAVEVPFTFYPREATRYQEKVVFQINDCTKQAVEVLGQGIEMQVGVGGGGGGG